MYKNIKIINESIWHNNLPFPQCDWIAQFLNLFICGVKRQMIKSVSRDFPSGTDTQWRVCNKGFYQENFWQ